MYRSSTLLLVLCFLTGCPDEPVKISPVPNPAPSLESGAYAVRVDSVASWACKGSNKADVVGEKFNLDLAIQGDRAHGNLDGLRLAGSAEPGFVYLDGSFYGVPMPAEDVEPDEDVDSRDEGDDEASNEGGTDGEDSDESVDAEAKCEPTYPDQPDVAEPDFSLDLSANNVHQAIGVLAVTMPDCSAELNVTATWIGKLEGRDHGGVVVYTEEGSTGEESQEEGGCGDDEDCG